MPNSIDVARECLNNGFESINALNGFCIDTLERINKLINKIRFLYTIFDQILSFCLNVFLDNRDVNSDKSMVQSESPVRIDMMMAMFR